MATLGNLYHNRSEYHNHGIAGEKSQPRSSPVRIATPSVPQSTVAKDQSFHRQPCQNLNTPSPQRSKAKNNVCHIRHVNDSRHSTVQPETYQSPDCKPPINRPSPGTENLKRRPSLREAARSFRSSRVVKKLRRQGKTEFDQEAEDDAGASASESDQSGDPLYGYQMGLLQKMDPPRSASVVSELSNGLQSSLTLTTHGRARGLSTISQASTRVMDNSDSASTNTSFTAYSGISNRGWNMDVDDLEGNDEDDTNRVHKRSCSVSVIGPEQPQLFACPFAKHDPQRYSAANLEELNYRGCSQSYLTDLARVKQHLYRVHERPLHYCPTCYEVFKSQAQCIKHVNLQSCYSRPCLFSEKMTPEQLAAIKKKNRGTDPYLGWYEIYKTLFPGSQPPHSPYAAFTATADTLEAFMEFVIRELPIRLQHQLGFRAPIIDVIQGPLPDALREIRKDFNPFMQQKPESNPQNAVELTVASVEEREGIHTQNYHYSATLQPSQQDQEHMRTPTIEIPPDIYLYPSAQSTQAQSGSIPLHTLYQSQPLQQDVRNNYAHQHFHYSVQNQGMMPDLNSGPPTAFYQPDIRESPHGYFAGQHQTQVPVPIFSMHIENQESWIPNMVTIEHSLDDSTMQDMMGRVFQGEFSNHQN